MELHTIGIDLGKTVFRLVGLNLRGEVVVRKKFSRKQLLHFTSNLQVEWIGMEACGGSHFPGRALREQGHEVRLMRGWHSLHSDSALSTNVMPEKSSLSIEAGIASGLSIMLGAASRLKPS